MKSEEAVFTDFNFSFITFPRQVFVGIFHVVFQQKRCRKMLFLCCVATEEMPVGNIGRNADRH